MDFDFILTAIVYLLVIIFIHMNLRDFCGTVKSNSSMKPSKSIQNDDNYKSNHDKDILTSEDDVNSESDLYSSFIDKDENNGPTTDKTAVDESSQMILNETEINQIQSNTANQDFMKYLNVEDNDNSSIYQQLTSPLQTNDIEITENDTNNDLNKFFANLKDEQYTFEPVPTKTLNNNKLYNNKTILNNDNDASNIQGFDEFNTSFSSV